MPFKFISPDKSFCDKIENIGYTSYNIHVKDFCPSKKTYYILPISSIGIIDDDYHKELSQLNDNIILYINQFLDIFGNFTLLKHKYLPIGSSFTIICNELCSIILVPIMLSPQNISQTQNVYYAIMSALYNIIILQQNELCNVDIIMSSIGYDVGKLSFDDIIYQLTNGIKHYHTYEPSYVNNAQGIVLCEPNLHQQPMYVENSEWFNCNVYI
jgi:hypothetical protein